MFYGKNFHFSIIEKNLNYCELHNYYTSVRDEIKHNIQP